MAKDYSAAIERMKEKAKEVAATNAPSSVPSPPTPENKDYSAAIERMRRQREYNDKMAVVNAQRAQRQAQRQKEFDKWLETRTQDVIKAELDEAKFNDSFAAPLSKEHFVGGLETTKAFFTGDLKKLREERKANDARIPELEAELARRQAYDFQQKYEDINTDSEEFKLKSQYKTTANGNKPTFNAFAQGYVGSGFDDVLYDAINGNPDAIKELQREGRQYDPYGLTGHFDLEELQMNDEEVAMYNYLHSTEGSASANEYLEYIRGDLYRRERESLEAEAAARVEGKGGKIKASLETIGTSPLKGLSYIGQGLDLLSSGKIDPNKSYNRYSYMPNAAREKVTENWGPAGSFAYNTALSMGDFLVASGISGGSGLATLILGSGSAADTTIDALDRGISSDRAFLLGTAAGVIEAATEKWSIDTLLEDYSKKGIKQFIISNIGAEASEEAISEVANTIADAIIAEDKSYWMMAVNQYKQMGMSESQAIAKAIVDKSGDVILAALGGALSGGVMAGGSVAINTGVDALQNAGDKAAERDVAYRGQNTIRDILNSDKYKDMRTEQQKVTVLPTAVEQERAKARENGEVFDIGYERPYTGYANTVADDELDARVNAAQTVTEKTGIRYGASEEKITEALELGRALGVEVEFFNQSSKSTNTVIDGFYNIQNGHIYVNVNAKKTVPTTISHEFTHSLEGTNEYNDLRDLVAKELKKRGDSLESAAQRLNKLYEKAGRSQDMKAGEADVIANFVEKNILGTQKSINKIVGAKPNLGRRVLAFLNRLLAQLRRGSSAYTTAKQIQEWYDYAVSNADEAPTAEGVEENVANESEKTAPSNNENEADTGEKVNVEDIGANLMEKHKKGTITDEEFDLLYESTERQIKGRERRAHNLDVKFASGQISEEEYVREAEKIPSRDDAVEIDLEKAKKNAEGYNRPKPKESWMRYSVSVLEDGRTYVTASRNIITGKTKAEQRRQITDFFNDLLEGEPSLDIHTIEGDVLTITKADTADKARDDYKQVGGKAVRLTDDEFAVKLRAEAHIDELAETSISTTEYLPDTKGHEFAKDGFTYRTAYFEDFDGKYYKIKLSIGNNGTIATVYNVGQIKEGVPPSAKLIAVVGSKPLGGTPSDTTISHSVSEVKTTDEDVTQTQQFKRWFGDWQNHPERASKVVNEDGTPKVMYHGTNANDEFWVFDTYGSNFGLFGMGSYFTDNYDVAQGYTKKGKGKNPRIYAVYLNIRNPIDMDQTADKEQWLAAVEEDDRSDLERYAKNAVTNEDMYKCLKELCADNMMYKEDAIEYITNVIQSMGFDGITHIGGGRYNSSDSERHRVYIAFEPNQIKSATDNIGTFDAENPDIRYSVSETDIPDDYKEFANSIPRRDSDHLRGIVNKLAGDMRKTLRLDIEKVRDGYRTKEYTDFIESVVHPIVMEYMKSGDISGKTVKDVFEANYNGTDKKKANDMKAFEKTVLSSISNLSAVRSAVLVNDAKERYTRNIIEEMADVVADEMEADSADEDVLGIEHLTPAAKRELRSVERSIANAAIKALGLDIETKLVTDENGKKHRSEKYLRFIREAVRPITNEYLRTGEVSEAIVNEIFEKKYDDAKVPNKKYSRAMFDRAIEYNVESLKIVRKVMRERKLREERTDNPKEAFTSEKYEALKKDLDYARRNEEKVKKAPGNLLTEHDEMLIGDVLAGIAKPQSINIQADNKKGAMAVYEAKLATKEAAKAEKQFRTDARDKDRKLSHDLLGGAEGIQRWHEKGNNPKQIEKLAKKGIFEEKIPGGWAYARETFVRNIYDVAPNKEIAARVIRELFYPIEQNEAANNKYSAQLIERVKKLNISQEVKEGDKFSEAYAVQYYGEAAYYVSVLEQMSDPDAQIGGGTLKDWRGGIDELFATSPGLDRAKIEKCAKEFRKIYDELYDKINDAYVRNGYRPLGKLEGYFPHFTKREDSFFTRLLRSSGVNVMRIDLPTSINGLTDTFKPGRKYFSHAEHRNGFRTDYDAIEGFESYLATAGKVIFHTDDIQRLRTFANEIRYLTGSDQVKAAMDEIYNNDTLDEEQKQRELGSIVFNGEYKLSKFVVWLDEYTNILAGKKSRYDRTMEDFFNRKAYLLAQAVKNRVGANMIAANASSMLTNFIPINQAGAILGPDYMLRGVWQTLMDLKHEGNIWDMSMFLINRRGHESLTQSRLRKWSDRASMPMSWVDAFAAASIIRASYARNLKYGLDESEAMYQADLFAASIMAGRSVGEMPTIFHAKNPLFQMFTQFQLEVNNEFSVLLKDIPSAERKRWSDATAIRYLLYFIGAALYNDLFEKLFGRRPALDPIGVVKETVEDVVEGADAYDAITGFATNAASQLPFVGSLLGGGRLPVTNALPNFGKLLQAATDSDWSPKKKWITVATELFDPIMYLAPPFAGGVLRKIFQTTDAWIQGGRYTYSNAGEKMLQYPIYKENAKDFAANLFVGELFGPTSLSSGREWVEGGFGSLSVMKTAVYEALVDADVGQRKAFKLINDLSDVKSEKPETKTETIMYEGIKVEVEVPVDPDADIATKAELQRQLLRDSDISGRGKSIVYFGLMASDKELALMATLDNIDADMGAVTDVLMSFKDAGSTHDKLQSLLDANLTDRDKRLLYVDRISESRIDDIEAFAAANMDFDTFLRANMEYNRLYNEDLSATEKATALARWINNNEFNSEQKAVIEEAFKYYSMMPAKPGRYDDFTEAGLDDEASYKLASALADLEPLEGKTSVSELQKCRAVIDTLGSPGDQMKALESVMNKSSYKKCVTAGSYGVDAETYVTFREALEAGDKDGNGSITQAEAEVAIDKMSGNLSDGERWLIELTGGSMPGVAYLTNTQRAVLWQLANPSWNPKNNPYSESVGRAIQELFK